MDMDCNSFLGIPPRPAWPPQPIQTAVKPVLSLSQKPAQIRLGGLGRNQVWNQTRRPNHERKLPNS
jgi:hypothetical protein